MWLLLAYEFVRPTMQASPELVRFSMWPLSCPQKERIKYRAQSWLGIGD